MNDLEHIEDYFAGRLPSPNRARFETRLQDDPAFAKTVAFYLLARQVARAEAQRRIKPLPVRRTPAWRVVALAASLAVIIGLSLYVRIWEKPTTVGDLADQYVTEQVSQLPINLDGQTDSLKIGASYFNHGAFKKAEAVFEAILQWTPAHPEALKFAGLVSLRLQNYDQAINHFHQLGRQTDLYANPGFYLEALARLKRGQPMDKNRAKKLLLTVIQHNLDGKAEAEQLVNRLESTY
ncbi:hypothetical protein GCM10027299_50800 [Larkinella ripae]